MFVLNFALIAKYKIYLIVRSKLVTVIIFQYISYSFAIDCPKLLILIILII